LVLAGGPDADKLDIVFFLKVPQEFVANPERIVPGAPHEVQMMAIFYTEMLHRCT
jgi:hypothetical protein